MKFEHDIRRKVISHNKDFDSWNTLKKRLHHANKIPEFKEREVWWCSVGANLGFEEDGKNKNFERPVLVIRKFNQWLFIGIPLTTQNKKNIFHFELPIYNGIKSAVILSQARALSAQRLIRRVRFVEPDIFADVCQKYAELTVKINVDKTKSLHKTGKSRTANADLYHHCSKSKVKSQVVKQKEVNK
jgi:mRNA interferase MazF